MDRFTILILDGDQEERDQTVAALRPLGFPLIAPTDLKVGPNALDNEDVGLVITDRLDLGDIDLLALCRKPEPPVEVVLLTSRGTVEHAVHAMSRGVLTYLARPVNQQELRAVVARAIERVGLERQNVDLHRQLDTRYGFEQIVGNSPQMEAVFARLRQASNTSATVLILGENGTGKELVAKCLHQNSARRNQPFVGLNCAALSENILESELFGHEKGAFTGALALRKGRFEYADGGTLFLDEVGDLPMNTQIKLLRVLEEREITRVGSNQPIAVDIRLIAATNRDLEELVEEGTFRRDLYYRLKVVTIELPPLRERQGDIPLLIDRFIEEFVERHQKPITGMTLDARRLLNRHHWPGNVRELRNTIENMVVVTFDTVLGLDDIPDYLVGEAEVSEPRGVGNLAGMTLEEVEKELIRETLRLTQGNREEAASMLGIGERTLYRKINKYELRE